MAEDWKKEPKEVKYDPLTPTSGQAEFLLAMIDPNIDEIFYVGGVGAGKTQALCQGVMEVAQIPNNRIAVTRKYAKDCVETTLTEFQASVNPELILDYSKSDKTLVIRSQHPQFPSTIYFRGCDERQRWGSTQFGHIFVDEGSELDQLDFEFIRTRLRHPFSKPGNPNGYPNSIQFLLDRESPLICEFLSEEGESEFDVHRFICVITNPTNNFHWIYKYCVEHLTPERKVVQVSSRDNFANLPRKYKEILENTPRNLKKTKVEGDWGLEVSGDPCTPAFDELINTFQAATPNEPLHIFRGWDFGYVYPAVSFWVLLDGTFYKFYEYLGLKEGIDTTMRNVFKLCEKEFHPDSSYEDHCDHHAGLQHSDKSIKTSLDFLRERGLFPKSKHSSPNARVDLFEECFRTGKLKIHKRCVHSITAYNGGYCRKNEGNVEAIDKDPKNPYHNIADSDGYPLFNVLGIKRYESRRDLRTMARGGEGIRNLMEKMRDVFSPNKQGRSTRPNYDRGYGT